MATLCPGLQDQTSTLGCFPLFLGGLVSTSKSHRMGTWISCLQLWAALQSFHLPSGEKKKKSDFSWWCFLLTAQLATDWPELLLCGWWWLRVQPPRDLNLALTPPSGEKRKWFQGKKKKSKENLKLEQHLAPCPSFPTLCRSLEYRGIRSRGWVLF